MKTIVTTDVFINKKKLKWKLPNVYFDSKKKAKKWLKDIKKFSQHTELINKGEQLIITEKINGDTKMYVRTIWTEKEYNLIYTEYE